MTDLLGEGSFLLGDSNTKPVEVLPEMLDYEFVDSCESVDELRAVLNSLESGEYGKYPHLEHTVKDKLTKLLESRKVTKRGETTLAIGDSNSEKENLKEWLSIGLSKNGAGERFKGSQAPVRSTCHIEFSDKERTSMACKEESQVLSRRHDGKGKLGTKVISSKEKPSATCVEGQEIFRKEKLSTKEYYTRWNKFDVDAALEEIDHEKDQEQASKDTLDSSENFHTMTIKEVDALPGTIGDLNTHEPHEAAPTYVKTKRKTNDVGTNGESDEDTVEGGSMRRVEIENETETGSEGEGEHGQQLSKIDDSYKSKEGIGKKKLQSRDAHSLAF